MLPGTERAHFYLGSCTFLLTSAQQNARKIQSCSFDKYAGTHTRVCVRMCVFSLSRADAAQKETLSDGGFLASKTVIDLDCPVSLMALMLTGNEDTVCFPVTASQCLLVLPPSGSSLGHFHPSCADWCASSPLHTQPHNNPSPTHSTGLTHG